MPKTALYNMDGSAIGEVELSEAIFAAPVNVAAMHLVVRSYLAAQRQGTQSAKTRGEVRGGGRKIYRQKGTGNARHHGNRAPQFRHGGVVFAPKPRSYRYKVPRSVRRLAMLSALSSKVQENEMIILDEIKFEEPKTKDMVKMLEAVKAGRKPLIIMSAFQLTAPGAADTGRIPSIMNSTAVPSAAAIRYFGRKMISTYISTNNIIAIFMYLYSLSE